MAGQSGTPLVAVALPRPQAATVVAAAWDRHDAVLVLDPDAPRVAAKRLLERFEPTHVTDVCIVGTADPEWGERVVAFVAARDASDPPTLEGLRAFGRDAGLSDAQVPRQIELVRVIPRAPSGKPLRRELRLSE